MNQTIEKPQITSTMLDMAAKCWLQFLWRFGARFDIWPTEEIIPPNSALIIGSATHKAVEMMLRDRMNLDNNVFEYYHEIAERNVTGAFSREVYHHKKPTKQELVETKSVSRDIACGLSQTYYDEVLADVAPLAVEKSFLIEMKGFDFDLSGKIDLEQKDEIDDVKTSGAYPAKDAAMSGQLGFYSMHHFTKTKKETGKGRLPKKVALQYLTHRTNKSGLSFTYTVRDAVPEKVWIAPAYRRMEQLAYILTECKRGKIDPEKAMMPASQSGFGSVCMARYCGYHRKCKMWSGRE